MGATVSVRGTSHTHSYSFDAKNTSSSRSARNWMNLFKKQKKRIEADEDDPLYLLSLNKNIQRTLLEKMSYQSFAKLVEASGAVGDLVEDLRFLPSFNVFAISFRTNSPYAYVVLDSSNRAYSATETYDYELRYIRKEKNVVIKPQRIMIWCNIRDSKTVDRILGELNGIKSPILSIRSSSITCTMEDLERLVKAIESSQIRFYRALDQEYVIARSICESKHLVLLENTQLNNVELLNMKSEHLFLQVEGITVHAINMILFQWCEGKRDLKLLRTFNRLDNAYKVLFLPHVVPATVIWTRAKKQHLAGVKHWKWEKPHGIYRLERKKDNEELYVAIYMYQFKIMARSVIRKWSDLCFEQLL